MKKKEHLTGLPNNLTFGPKPLGSKRHSGSNNPLRTSQVNWTLLYFSCLYWGGNLVVGWELSPLPSTLSYYVSAVASLVWLMVRGKSFCLHAFLGVLLPTTLVHSQLHQRHLMRTTCFHGARTQPFFQSRLLPNRFRGGKVHWQIALSSNLFFRPLQRVEHCVDFCFS